MLSDRSGALPSRRRAATARILCSDCGETRLETADRERVSGPGRELNLINVEQCSAGGKSLGVGRRARSPFDSCWACLCICTMHL